MAALGAQLGLFEAGSSWLDALPPEDPYGLRYFQQDAVDAVFDCLKKDRSTLLDMATGTGKTTVFGAIVGQWEGRVLVLAHRDELIQQAAKRLQQMTGEVIGIEQAELHSGMERIVVGSVQTAHRARRLQRLKANGGFSLIVVDEAHRATARTYRKIFDAFPQSKILGVTATPDRTDGEALGKVFDDVAYRYGIEQGIEDGYLVPIEGQRAYVETIDLSGLKANELTGKKLDEVMLRAVEGIVRTTLERWPDRYGPMFFPGKQSSRYAAERFNALKPGCAAAITDDTDPLERRQIIRAIHNGDIQFLCNFGIATEGFDWPHADIVGIGRPTKSRLTYAQMVGRGTRVLPGLVEGVEGAETRRQIIAASNKPHVVIADFVGNSGKHNLAQVEDVLGGKYSDEEKAEAKKRAKAKGGGNPSEHLEEARRYLKTLQQAAKEAKSKVEHKVEPFSPFSVFHLDRNRVDDMERVYGRQPATDRQVSTLKKFGVEPKAANRMSKAEAKKVLDTCFKRMELGLATFRQTKQLARFGLNNPNIPKKRADAAMNYLQQKGWGKTGYIDPEALRRIVEHKGDA